MPACETCWAAAKRKTVNGWILPHYYRERATCAHPEAKDLSRESIRPEELYADEKRYRS